MGLESDLQELFIMYSVKKYSKKGFLENNMICLEADKRIFNKLWTSLRNIEVLVWSRKWKILPHAWIRVFSELGFLLKAWMAAPICMELSKKYS